MISNRNIKPGDLYVIKERSKQVYFLRHRTLCNDRIRHLDHRHNMSLRLVPGDTLLVIAVEPRDCTCDLSNNQEYVVVTFLTRLGTVQEHYSPVSRAFTNGIDKYLSKC
jgi:hypothetical protein